MARIPYPDPSTLPEHVRGVFERVPDLNIFRMISYAENALRPFLRFTAALWDDSELTTVQRELIILVVAELTGAEYERVQHEPIALKVGVTQAQIAAIAGRCFQADVFDDVERALLLVTRGVVEAHRHDDAEFARALDLLGPRAMIETHLLAGVYRSLAGIMLEFDLDIDGAQADAMLTLGRRANAV